MNRLPPTLIPAELTDQQQVFILDLLLAPPLLVRVQVRQLVLVEQTLLILMKLLTFDVGTRWGLWTLWGG